MPPPPRFPRIFQSPLLQPPLHKLFVPRPLLDVLPPTDYYLDGYRGPRVSAVAPYIESLDEEAPPFIPTIPIQDQIKQKREKAKAENHKRIDEQLEAWKPSENPNATTDAIKTLFVGRLPYDLTERQLKREFEVYGEIEEIKMVKEQVTEKFKGYAFIQFAKEEDMKAAYKDADGKKINGRRIVVDVERGRTVKNWKPRRLGGGLGRTRVGGPDVNQKYSGRDSGDDRRRSQDRERERSQSPHRRSQRPEDYYRHRR